MRRPPPPVRIEPGEAQSPTWQKLKAYARARLEQLREENEGDLAPEQTAKIRGKIAEVKAFLDLDQERARL